MNEQVQQLINEAKSVAIKSKKLHGRTRYPAKLKKIIFSLVNDHGVRPKDIMAFVPISAHSVRSWSYIKKSTTPFNQIKLTKPKSQISLKSKKDKHKSCIEVQVIFLSAQILLLAWQLSLH